jgi:hypothetical protein
MKTTKAPGSCAPKVEPKKNGVSELREQVRMLSNSDIGVEEKINLLTALCEVILDYVESNSQMIQLLLKKSDGTK